MTHRNFQLLRVLGSALRMKAEVDSSSRGQKGFIFREEKRKVAWGHAVGPKTCDPLGQVRNWVFIAIFLALGSLRCKQKFPRKEKCFLGQLSPFGTSCTLSFKRKERTTTRKVVGPCQVAQKH
jgi:hypothetical protein